MNDGFVWWLIIVGLAIGIALAWLLLVRLPRAEDDIGADEREAEAEWISRTIEEGGGIAPVSLVDEVLELHQTYLASPGLAQPRTPPTPVARSAEVPVRPVDPPSRT